MERDATSARASCASAGRKIAALREELDRARTIIEEKNRALTEGRTAITGCKKEIICLTKNLKDVAVANVCLTDQGPELLQARDQLRNKHAKLEDNMHELLFSWIPTNTDRLANIPR
jgi:chromosome segregation ATPase